MVPKLYRLLSYISDSELRSRYRRDFVSSIRGMTRTYDFALITAWKLFMLFIYERLWQIPEDDLKKALKNHADVTKQHRVKSWLWANNVDDDSLISCLDNIYGAIDSNYLKRAKSIHHQRKAAAHVSEIVNDAHSVDAFLKELINIVEKIQKCHQEYLDKVDLEKLPDNIQELRLSRVDIEYLITSLIRKFKESDSFDSSTSTREKLLQLKEMLSKEHIDMILTAIQVNSNNHQYHQILQASGASGFIKTLYSVHPEPSDSWKKFAEYIVAEFKEKNIEHWLERYNWLFATFSMPNYKKPAPPQIDEIDLDDIPF